ncbi:sensor histidine kinase [Emticicia sp. SJ17W-69]|uniref:sensor histidine kinase n=1 Tax=Emticicia sp. SJ17W-69 TaxID=3421657 RepID=UPI003EB94B20
MFKNRYLYTFLHGIIWLGYTTLPLLNLQRDSDRPSVNPYTSRIYWAYVSISCIILFYIHSEYLFPRIYKKKPIQYFLLLIVVMVCLVMGRYYVRINFVEGAPSQLFYVNTFIQYFFIFGISASYCFFSDYQKTQQVQRETENERLKSELSFLRSQISPHFMFNLMNSLVSLNRKKSDLVEPVLLKMSDLLRYMLYEKDDKQISLDNEVKYLENYIDLQKVRFADYVEINFFVNKPLLSKNIEPMLLIPFVENAFKHGVGLVEKPIIKIELETTKNQLHFKVTNKFSSDKQEVKDGASGIGLANVKRRLELLYPNQYVLNVEEKDNLYTTDLQLNFKQ